MNRTILEAQVMKISDVKAKLSSLVNEVYRKERRILVEKAGIPVAAVISVDDLERLNQFERERRERFAVIDEMREAFKDIPDDQIERDVTAIVREMRDEREAARRAAEQGAIGAAIT
jgi:prevent-host-death family protein